MFYHNKWWWAEFSPLFQIYWREGRFICLGKMGVLVQLNVFPEREKLFIDFSHHHIEIKITKWWKNVSSWVSRSSITIINFARLRCCYNIILFQAPRKRVGEYSGDATHTSSSSSSIYIWFYLLLNLCFYVSIFFIDDNALVFQQLNTHLLIFSFHPSDLSLQLPWDQINKKAES